MLSSLNNSGTTSNKVYIFCAVTSSRRISSDDEPISNWRRRRIANTGRRSVTREREIHTQVVSCIIREKLNVFIIAHNN